MVRVLEYRLFGICVKATLRGWLCLEYCGQLGRVVTRGEDFTGGVFLCRFSERLVPQ